MRKRDLIRDKKREFKRAEKIIYCQYGLLPISALKRLSKRFKTNKNECWIWLGLKNKYGYGVTSIYKNHVYVHRAYFEHFNGKIKDGLQIDHLCRVRNCANPEHMEAVTQRENIMRGNGICSINAKKTSCKNGHEYNQGHLYTYPDGRRLCMTCQKLRLKEKSDR